MFTITTTKTAQGKQNGYAILTDDGVTFQVFRNKDYRGWGYAKTTAERACEKLNRDDQKKAG